MSSGRTNAVSAGGAEPITGTVMTTSAGQMIIPADVSGRNWSIAIGTVTDPISFISEAKTVAAYGHGADASKAGRVYITLSSTIGYGSASGYLSITINGGQTILTSEENPIWVISVPYTYLIA